MPHQTPNPHDAEEALKPLQGALFEAQEALNGWNPAAYPTHESATTAWDLASDAVMDAQDAVIAKALELLGVQR